MIIIIIISIKVTIIINIGLKSALTEAANIKKMEIRSEKEKIAKIISARTCIINANNLVS